MAAPIPRKLKKGELLFNEGDISKSMYFVQSGTIRLFKKKGNASIELGMIHKGEVIGEMGFLDGGPRSASAEAIHDTDLMEITNSNLVEQLKVLPPWLMVLLKTVVNRLRSANNKIRQLETASTTYNYGGDSGGNGQTYQYLNVYDVLKIATAVLVCGARNPEPGPNGSVKVQMNRINRYANQIMGIHAAKITELVDILERVGLAQIDNAKLDAISVVLKDVDQIELLVTFINDDNLKDHAKKISFSPKAVAIMGYMVKHIELFPPNPEGISDVNLAKILELEKPNHNGKEAFRLDDTFNEIVKSKIATDLALKDNNTIITRVSPKTLVRMYRIQKFIKEVEILNEQKREQARRGAATR
ncbi:MAG: Crp/Fnr family transcriptional regulator [Deltaproteobacteria bacterium]|nr:Crp/Fnr family transcriptional regulator [Deltaproteobacteria bacterium]